MRRYLLLPILLLAACAKPSTDGREPPAPTWEGTPDIVIRAATPDAGGFSRVAGIAVDSGGRVFVADAQANVVQVFDSTGKALFRFGGPGELAQPCCLAFDPAGRLWLRDAANGRYNVYQAEADGVRLLRQVPMNHPVTGSAAEITFDGRGGLIDAGSAPLADGRSALLRFHQDSTGTVTRVDTIPVPPDDSIGQFTTSHDGTVLLLQQPYGPRFAVASSPLGGWASAVTTRYQIRWVVDGDTAVRTIRRDMIGPALSARERARGDSALDQQAARLGAARAELPFGVPGSKPPLHTVLFDREGRLWAQMSAADEGANRADIWLPNGRRLAMAQWPGDIDLRHGWVGNRRAWGVRADSAGVREVVRVVFR
ncbi:MAG: hypothetical protein AB7I33_06600 [Gemmatimonadales bacterium]